MILTALRQGIVLSFAYRKAMFISLLGEVVLIISLFFLWTAVYESGNQGMDDFNIASYIVAARIVSIFVQTPPWGFFFDAVRKGTVILDITKPISLFKMHLYRWIGQKIGQFLLFIPLYTLIYYIFIFSGNDSMNIQQLTFGAISILFAMLCAFTFEIAFGTVTFFTNSIQGLNEAKALFIALTSGSLFPLDVLPKMLKEIVSFLPFKYIVYTPSKILTSDDWASYFTMEVYYQIAWIIIFYALYSALIRLALEKYNSAGG